MWLLVDGKSLTFALDKELSKAFLELATLCKAVVCCMSFYMNRCTSASRQVDRPCI